MLLLKFWKWILVFWRSVYIFGRFVLYFNFIIRFLWKFILFFNKYFIKLRLYFYILSFFLYIKGIKFVFFLVVVKILWLEMFCLFLRFFVMFELLICFIYKLLLLMGIFFIFDGRYVEWLDWIRIFFVLCIIEDLEDIFEWFFGGEIFFFLLLFLNEKLNLKFVILYCLVIIFC